MHRAHFELRTLRVTELSHESINLGSKTEDLDLFATVRSLLELTVALPTVVAKLSLLIAGIQ